MNRYKRHLIAVAEEKARAREAMSTEEIARLEEEEAREAQVLKEAERYHSALFPEEYDEIGDDYVDLRKRERGENPMSPWYTELTNQRRVDLAFAPYEVPPYRPLRGGKKSGRERYPETFAWVKSMVASGESESLRALILQRIAEEDKKGIEVTKWRTSLASPEEFKT